MIGPRITTVFRSKWRALWFAGSVLAGAYYSVPRQDDKADPDQQKAAQAIAAIVDQKQPAKPEHHVNPWAKTPQ